jgi:hypothetical protein
MSAPIMQSGLARLTPFTDIAQFQPLLSVDAMHETLYKKVNVTFSPFFSGQRVVSESFFPVRGISDWTSSLRQDVDAIVLRLQKRKSPNKPHALHALAREALAEMKKRGIPKAAWGKKIATQMTDADD